VEGQDKKAQEGQREPFVEGLYIETGDDGEGGDDEVEQIGATLGQVVL
jgi:hypothetical protein